MVPGLVLAGRFELVRVAGSGGMATVWIAHDRAAGIDVAVKVQRPRFEPNDEAAATAAARFDRESRVLAEMRHPAIVRYVAHGLESAGERWLAMEWVEGESLHERLKRGPLTIPQSMELARRLAEGLAYAHQAGVVHRDVKPSNVLLEGSDPRRPKLVDFGLARPAGPSELTATQAFVGTPGYVAPEQARGLAHVDGRADLFSLGCVVFACVSGRRVVGPDDDLVAALAKTLLEEPPRLATLRPHVPPALDDLVARLLNKDPDGRPRSAAAVAASLAEIEIEERSITSVAPVTVEAPRTDTSETRPSVLTTGEQRVVSLVLTTAPERRDAATDAALDAQVAAHGAHRDRLADGSLLVTIHGSGHASDQAIRASRCALAVHAALPGVRTALATGRGELTRATLVGEVIERAATLLARGTPSDGGVRIDEVTAGLIGPRFEVAGDEHALVLRRERDEIDATRLLLGRYVESVGRDRELGIVRALGAECFDEPASRAVLLVGPPGIGKSRVLHDALRALPHGAEVWFGRGDPVGAGSTLAMLTQALRGAAGMRAGETPDVARQKLSALVSRHVAAAERAQTTEFLGEMVGASMPETATLRAARQDATLMADQMRAAFGALLAAQCGAHPVVLALEDLHWGDLATVRFVDAALRDLADRPLLVLATARAEALDTFPHLWEGRRVQQIRLEPLGRRASERIVHDALGDLATPEIVARVVGNAEGNPFFLEELIRHAAEGHDEVPSTVLATMQARLLALEPDARRVLRAASIFGQNFWLGGVETLVGEHGASVARWLGLLEDREVVVRRSESRLEGETEYAFRHALLREAAYAMLTSADRTLGHGIAGPWLEARGETDAACLAEHLAIGGEPARAIGWYRRAAQQALDANDLDTAVARAARAIECGAAGPVRGAVEMLAAEALVWRGDISRALERARLALELLPRGEDLWYRTIGALALYAARNDRADVLEHLLDELREVEGSAPRPSRVAALGQLASALTHAAMRPRAREVIDVAEREAHQLGELEPFVVAHLRAGRGFVSAADDDVETGLHGMSDAADAFEQAGALRSATSLQANAAYVLMLFGRYADAERRLRRAAAAAERLHLPAIVTFAKHNLGLVLGNRGLLAEAGVLEQAAVEGFRASGDGRGEGGALTYLARIQLAAGDARASALSAREAVTKLGGHQGLRANALATLSSACLAMGDVPGALASAGEAKAALDEAGSLEEGEALVRIAWTEALHASGDTEGARRAVIEARDSLLVRAEAIRDPELRRSFLEDVPEHARTTARAQEWGAAREPH
jgi:tRNA A-37 threonylcarbamoyl transferase component Bud32/tetratricopeptide (TPR) repeat protein